MTEDKDEVLRLTTKLRELEQVIEALRKEDVDAIVGTRHVLLLRLKEAEEQLTRHRLELEAANSELEAFAYSVSHDLQAPLRRIEGFSQALLEDYRDNLDDRGKRYLSAVRESSEEMRRLIDDLLRLSLVARSEPDYLDLDLAEIARGVVAELRQANPERKVKVEIAPRMVAQGDYHLLRLVLENLIGNAWKFTGKVASPRIEVGVTDRDGKKVYFVRDNGAGFDMAYAGKLFMPFQRLHSDKEFSGTGIGLATVRRIIKRHGGEVWGEGKKGEGAIFCFTLPVVKS